MANKRIKDLSTTAAVTASDDFIAVDGATNGTRKLDAYSPTFGGNLTVSGTGTSSFAGNLTLSTSGSRIATGTSDGTDNKYLSFSGGGAAANTRGSSVYVTGNEFTTGNAKGSLQLEAGYDATMSNTMDGSVLFSTGGTAVVGYFNRIGNLILGPAAADSGNGKLQLATHTTSAGGIGFGTDISLFRRNANGALALNATSGNPALYFRDNATDTASLGTVDGDLYVTVPTAKTIYFSTNNTTALTLFSNQAAAFSGNLTVSGGTITSGSGTLTLKSSANTVVLQSANTTALTLDSSQLCILAGALRLNNAYTASAVVPTGYVTIQDSTGTTYKVCVLL